MALVFSGVRIVNDDAMVAVAIRDIKLVRRLVDKHFRGTLEVFDIVAAFALAGMPDLHQEFSVLREFQDHVVVERSTPGLRLICGGSLRRRGNLRTAAVAADPDVSFVIDGDSMIRDRPIVTLARSSPVPDEIALLVELENRRSRHATF